MLPGKRLKLDDKRECRLLERGSCPGCYACRSDSVKQARFTHATGSGKTFRSLSLAFSPHACARSVFVKFPCLFYVEVPLRERGGQEERPVLPGVGVVASVEKQGRKAVALHLDVSDMGCFAIFREAVRETLNRRAMSWKTDGQDVHHDRQQRIADQ